MNSALKIFIPLVLIFIYACNNQNEKKFTITKDNKTANKQDHNKDTQNVGDTQTYEQTFGEIEGIIKSVNLAIDDIGAITIKTSEGVEKLYQYNKNDFSIDTTIIGKRYRIFWSLQVDTNLDEANSFYLIDSMKAL